MKNVQLLHYEFIHLKNVFTVTNLNKRINGNVLRCYPKKALVK